MNSMTRVSSNPELNLSFKFVPLIVSHTNFYSSVSGFTCILWESLNKMGYVTLKQFFKSDQ